MKYNFKKTKVKYTPSLYIAKYQDVSNAPFPLVISYESLAVLLNTVARNRPETGAKIFAKSKIFGMEILEYDMNGSAGASSVVYSPDVKWGEDRMQFHLNQEEPGLWSGDLHSHPGESGIPSSESGKGLGDMGYVREVFEQNETMQYFLMPIITGCGPESKRITLHPWIVERGERNPRLLIAKDVIIGTVENFPERIFNPEWLSTLEGTEQ